MKKLLICLLTLTLCLTGCSSANIGSQDNITVKWENGVVSYKGTPMPIKSYRGCDAVAIGSDGTEWKVWIDPARDFTSISTNTQSVLEENMDEYKGFKYFVEYLNTQFTIAGTVDADYKKVALTLNRDGVDENVTKVIGADILNSIPVTNGVVKVDFGPFVFGTDYDMVEVRPDCALITGVIKVSQGTHDTTSTTSIVQGNKEYQVSYGSSQNYDYYVYEGYVIQIVKGMDIGTYIQFN